MSEGDSWLRGPFFLYKSERIRYARTKALYPVRNKSSSESTRASRASSPQDGQAHKGVYVNRAFGSDCHHCVIDGDIDAGNAAR